MVLASLSMENKLEAELEMKHSLLKVRDGELKKATNLTL